MFLSWAPLKRTSRYTSVSPHSAGCFYWRCNADPPQSRACAQLTNSAHAAGASTFTHEHDTHTRQHYLIIASSFTSSVRSGEYSRSPCVFTLLNPSCIVFFGTLRLLSFKFCAYWSKRDVPFSCLHQTDRL